MQRGIESMVMVAGLQGRFVKALKTENDIPIHDSRHQRFILGAGGIICPLGKTVLLCESSNKATVEVDKLGSGTCIPIRLHFMTTLILVVPPESRATRPREIH